MVGWLWRVLCPLLVAVLLAGCGVIGDAAWPEATLTLAAVPASTGGPAAPARPGVTPTLASGVAISPTPEATLPAIGATGTDGLPVTVLIPQGWTSREVSSGIVIVEDEASLASAELECPALLVRVVPEATSRADLLASFELAGVVSEREIPLVIAGNPVDALDITVSSAATGRIYQVVLAPLMFKGEGLLFVASMPEGQARSAWPVLATMLGSVTAVSD
ncbi:MAG: hypothetical protein R6X16_03060 [Anaerolineae bacterium]